MTQYITIPTVFGDDSTEDDQGIRLDHLEAAKLTCDLYGQQVYEVEVCGLRSAFNAYWVEVDRIMGQS